MSYAEDNGIDVGIPDITRSNNGVYWTTKAGDIVRICDMTNEHLYNAYKKFNDDRLEKEIIGRIFKRICL